MIFLFIVCEMRSVNIFIDLSNNCLIKQGLLNLIKLVVKKIYVVTVIINAIITNTNLLYIV